MVAIVTITKDLCDVTKITQKSITIITQQLNNPNPFLCKAESHAPN
jgi:hypothetical protein